MIYNELITNIVLSRSQDHIQEFSSVKQLDEDNERCLNRMTDIYDRKGEEIESLKQRLEDGHVISFNGDAIYERRKSIYSPEFYSSLTGYKMRSRLFLNGVNNARGAYLSVFFMLNRGEYDALLKWPFDFKVSFTLLDQSIPEDNQHHFSDFVWSDTRSNCFQRPRSEMNEAYGIEYFISLEHFRQNQHRYVHDNTMFIKVEVDFTSTSSDKKLILDPGEILLNDEQHTNTNDDDSVRRFLFTMESSNRTH